MLVIKRFLLQNHRLCKTADRSDRGKGSVFLSGCESVIPKLLLSEETNETLAGGENIR